MENSNNHEDGLPKLNLQQVKEFMKLKISIAYGGNFENSFKGQNQSEVIKKTRQSNIKACGIII